MRIHAGRGSGARRSSRGANEGRVAHGLGGGRLGRAAVHLLGIICHDLGAVPRDELLGEGHVLAEDDAGYAVAVDTRLTPELADEGLARELVREISKKL